MIKASTLAEPVVSQRQRWQASQRRERCTTSLASTPRPQTRATQTLVLSARFAVCSTAGHEKYGWTFNEQKATPGVNNVEELPIESIRRPLQGTRSNDTDKVQALMESIGEVGLQEPIDVLLVEGTYYGFSGCHRYEACQRLGMDKILAKVRKANRQILKMHFM